jgi:hypothetical protein
MLILEVNHSETPPFQKHFIVNVNSQRQLSNKDEKKVFSISDK